MYLLRLQDIAPIGLLERHTGTGGCSLFATSMHEAQLGQYQLELRLVFTLVLGQAAPCTGVCSAASATCTGGRDFI